MLLIKKYGLAGPNAGKSLSTEKRKKYNLFGMSSLNPLALSDSESEGGMDQSSTDTESEYEEVSMRLIVPPVESERNTIDPVTLSRSPSPTSHHDGRDEEQRKLKNKYQALKRKILKERLREESLDTSNLDTRHVESGKKIRTMWKSIIDKYSVYDEDNQGDIVNLEDMDIEDYTGHLESLAHERNVWDAEEFSDEGDEQNTIDPFTDPINLINLKPTKSKRIRVEEKETSESLYKPSRPKYLYKSIPKTSTIGKDVLKTRSRWDNESTFDFGGDSDYGSELEIVDDVQHDESDKRGEEIESIHSKIAKDQDIPHPFFDPINLVGPTSQKSSPVKSTFGYRIDKRSPQKYLTPMKQIGSNLTRALGSSSPTRCYTSPVDIPKVTTAAGLTPTLQFLSPDSTAASYSVSDKPIYNTPPSSQPPQSSLSDPYETFNNDPIFLLSAKPTPRPLLAKKTPLPPRDLRNDPAMLLTPHSSRRHSLSVSDQKITSLPWRTTDGPRYSSMRRPPPEQPNFTQQPSSKSNPLTAAFPSGGSPSSSAKPSSFPLTRVTSKNPISEVIEILDASEAEELENEISNPFKSPRLPLPTTSNFAPSSRSTKLLSMFERKEPPSIRNFEAKNELASNRNHLNKKRNSGDISRKQSPSKSRPSSRSSSRVRRSLSAFSTSDPVCLLTPKRSARWAQA